MSATSAALRSRVEPYEETRADDEAYEEIFRAFAARDLNVLAAQVQRNLADAGVRFSSTDGASEFAVDPVPRIIRAGEWSALSAALVQRVEALERFVADIYSRQEILAAGVVPRATVLGASYYEPQLAGSEPPRWITIAGLDVVRGPDGTLAVLEDNLRTPSGLAYAAAVREAVLGSVSVPPNRSLASFADLPAMLRAALTHDGGALAAIVSDGENNSAYYEHQALARLAGLVLVQPDQLEQRGGRLWLRRERGRQEIGVLYRRTNADRMFEPDGRLSALGELVFEPWRRGRLRLVNAFGTGVADDKLLHAHVEEMVRFYLGEEPLIASVPTHDLTRPDVLETTLERLDELVVKPRDGYGGEGVVIGPQCDAGELDRVRARVRRHPSAFVAQELVTLSVHPTVCEDGRLFPRHVDLRPFVIAVGERLEVVPGGLTRVARDAGSMIVNSTRSGGAKDTWVLA